ncbi:MAG: two-component regulator propeller domain-containing protein [Flavobacteriales bacterium]
MIRVKLQCLLVVWTSLSGVTAWAQYEVSSWRDHFPYGAAAEVMFARDVVVARTPNALFTVDTATYEVSRVVKGTALSQGNPSALGYDAERGQWIVAYEDGGIDLRDAAGTTNIPDLRIAQVVGSKRIESIYVEGDFAYLASAVGVVVLDLTKQEIADTWSLTAADIAVDARCVTSHDSMWLVGTSQGVLAAAKGDPFLANPDRWTAWEGAPDLGGVLELKRFAGTWWMVTEVPESDLTVVWTGSDDGLWDVMPGWEADGLPFGGMANGSWILAEDGSRAEGMLVASCCDVWGWDAQGEPEALANEVPAFAYIRDLAIAENDPQGRVWMASNVGGVVTWVPQPTASSIPTRTNRPDGPPNAAVRRMDCWNDNLWVATGAVSASWTPQYRSDGLFQYRERDWHVPALPENANDVAGVKDILDVSIDPTDPSHVVFASYEEGLLELRDGQVVRVLNAENSSMELSEVGGSPRSAVSGVDFDTDGNLWFTTPWTTTCLHVMLPDGTTVGMNLGDEGQNLLFGDIEVTRDGYVWAVLPRGNGVLVYDPAGTPENPVDDNWTILTKTPGQGGLPSNDVFCIEEDLDDEIWVGTANGPCVFYQSSTVFGDDVNASQILISQDGNLQYLLETDVVQSLIIDAGNRKWVGTQGSGVYVLASDGLTTDRHFTVDNSPLPSNDIQDIAMDYGSGEVYLGTAKGLMSYRGEATNWDREMQDVRIMPNPIRADHEGPIVIDGLAYQSTVHITDATGNRIAVLESNGGRATWDGKMEDGRQAPYGVYLAFATDRNGKEGAVVKFAVLR